MTLTKSGQLVGGPRPVHRTRHLSQLRISRNKVTYVILVQLAAHKVKITGILACDPLISECPDHSSRL